MTWPRGMRPVSEDDHVFARFEAGQKPALEAAAKADRDAGHTLTPVLMEFAQEDGALDYEVMDGPRCDHMCSACRKGIDTMGAEFGSAAIGVFGDSMGGEMEQLRRELQRLAATIRASLPAPQRAELRTAEAEVNRQLETARPCRCPITTARNGICDSCGGAVSG